MTLPAFLKMAQSITQEYIKKYGLTFIKINELDNMIAEALRKTYYQAFTYGYEESEYDDDEFLRTTK